MSKDYKDTPLYKGMLWRNLGFDTFEDYLEYSRRQESFKKFLNRKDVLTIDLSKLKSDHKIYLGMVYCWMEEAND